MRPLPLFRFISLTGAKFLGICQFYAGGGRILKVGGLSMVVGSRYGGSFLCKILDNMEELRGMIGFSKEVHCHQVYYFDSGP